MDQDSALIGAMTDEAIMSARKLRRDIIVILSIKTSIVVLASLFVFGPHQRPLIDGGALDRHIFNNSHK
jgi:hypothetical protein